MTEKMLTFRNLLKLNTKFVSTDDLDAAFTRSKLEITSATNIGAYQLVGPNMVSGTGSLRNVASASVSSLSDTMVP